MKKELSTLLFCFMAFWCTAQKIVPNLDTPQSFPAQASQGHLVGSVPALSTLTPQTELPYKPKGKTWSKKNYFHQNENHNPNPLPIGGGDALVKKGPKNTGNTENGLTLTEGVIIEGLRDNTGVTPPDPTGDIGKEHYVSMVNTSGGAWFQVWDKEGNSVYGPALTSTIWSQVGQTSIGDPIIQYDHDAERWIMCEMQGGNELLFAISDTYDPTGSWKVYEFQTIGFPDYPKVYVWPDAYYISVNEITDGNKCSGYALQRSAMLAGQSFFKSYRFEMPNYQAIQYQPSTGVDWEGGPPPPPGSPGLLMRMYEDAWDGGTDHLEIWEVHVDWSNVASSELVGPNLLYPTPYDAEVCWSWFNCIEQPGTSSNMEALDMIIMYRCPYRNFGSYESIVLSHMTDFSNQSGPGGDAAVRWYELRKYPGGDWQIYQEGAYAPDQENRFFTGISIDASGNIAMGYTTASSSTYPGARITGRRAGDPPGEMTIDEYILANGDHAHESGRWGDYSVMSVDPTDGRTFWYVSEYQPADDLWGTRIMSFTLRRDTFDIGPRALTAPLASPTLGNNEVVKAQLFNYGLQPGTNISVTLRMDGQDIVTDNIPGTILPDQMVEHTFSQMVNMPVPGQYYNFEIISHFGPDQYIQNDTLRVKVRKLTSNDAAITGIAGMPSVVCATEYTPGLIIKNTAAVALTSATIEWSLNSGATQVINWTGTLAPGASDTLDLPITGIIDGPNNLVCHIKDPNGILDEDNANNDFSLAFNGNLNGSIATVSVYTLFGSLNWEVLDDAGGLLFSGTAVEGETIVTEICVEDNTCYTLKFSTTDFNGWQGQFYLYDIFGNELINRTSVFFDESTSFCTPSRQSIDVGPYQLTSPVTASGLTAAEPVIVAVRNFGLTPQTGITISYKMNGGTLHTETVNGTLQPGETQNYQFATTEDLSTLGGLYTFDIYTVLANDEQPGNDAIHPVVQHKAPRDAAIKDFFVLRACSDPNFVEAHVVFENKGLENIDYLQLDWTLNGVAQFPLNIYPFLPPGAEYEHIYFIYNSQFGDNTLTGNVTNVNNQGEDFTPANDLGSVDYVINPNGFWINFNMYLDDKPGETTWEVIDDMGAVVYSGGPYQQAFGNVFLTFCLKAGKCYHLKLHDSGGDGMYGQIFMEANFGQVWTFFGDNFGSELIKDFCAESPCVSFNMTTQVENASGPTSMNGKITINATGGIPPYEYSLTGLFFSSQNVYSNLNPGNYHIYSRDNSGCLREQIVYIGISAVNDLNASNLLKISPNPTKGIVTVDFDAENGEQNGICEVYDAQGRFLFNLKMTLWDNNIHGVFALDTYPAGTYQLRIKTAKRILLGRAIKQ